MPDSRGRRRIPDSRLSEIDVPNLDPAAAIARRQRGVVTRRQLRAAGLTSRAIDYRLRTGRLHRIYRGAYLVGHPVAPPLAAETAALLVCGPDSLLSHRAAARIWEISDAGGSVIDVTVARRIRSRQGLRVHQAAVERPDVRTREGLPVTAP